MTTNKKGDILDGMFYFGSVNSDPVQFSDYPERVLNTLRIFYSVWKIPSHIIPSVKNKSKFEEWLLQLDELNAICPNTEKMRKAMELSLTTYNEMKSKFMVIRPASIKSLLANSVAQINREAESLPAQESIVVSASKEEKLKTVKSLKNFLEEENA